MEQRVKRLEEKLVEIQKRNERVELDKVWKTSSVRKLLVAGLTYLVILLFFVIIKIERPMINALVPTLGYLLSTLTITSIKAKWIENKKRTN